MPAFAIFERGGSVAFFAEEGRWGAWGCFFFAASLCLCMVMFAAWAIITALLSSVIIVVVAMKQ
jgi:hypothetical protein